MAPGPEGLGAGLTGPDAAPPLADGFCSGLLSEGGDTLQRVPVGTAGHTQERQMLRGLFTSSLLLPAPWPPCPPGYPDLFLNSGAERSLTLVLVSFKDGYFLRLG